MLDHLKKETTDNEDGENAEYFVPNQKAKHRVPKHYNLNNPTQKKRNSKKQVEEKKVQERKLMKCKHEPSTSSEEEDTDTKQSDSVPPQKEKKNYKLILFKLLS